MNTEAARFKFIMNSLGRAALMLEIFLFVCAFLSTLRYHKTFGVNKREASMSKGVAEEVQWRKVQIIKLQTPSRL